jgi:DNA-binding GntR family transcriptional regulator
LVIDALYHGGASTMSSPRDGAITARSAAKGSNARQVYESLRGRILNLDLRPGADLDESTLVEMYGVSRTPVREALIRLGAEHLVTLLPNRGARVAPIDLQTLDAFFEALNLTQRAVTRWAAIRHSAAHLRPIRAAMKAVEVVAARGDAAAVTDRNCDFHLAIADAAGNDYVADAYRRMLLEGLRLSRISLTFKLDRDNSLAAHIDKVLDDHRVIVEALVARDADRAEALGGTHAWLFRDRVVKNLTFVQADEITIEDREQRNRG